ncbi:MAG: hypothetical protein J3K34DRAFT_398216 [Monoraphidium minutum]|nr:MAG: hypothetical protein J3K34DRAFT_398216 [Monoraphidium minutum]
MMLSPARGRARAAHSPPPIASAAHTLSAQPSPAAPPPRRRSPAHPYNSLATGSAAPAPPRLWPRAPPQAGKASYRLTRTTARPGAAPPPPGGARAPRARTRLLPPLSPTLLHGRVAPRCMELPTRRSHAPFRSCCPLRMLPARARPRAGTSPPAPPPPGSAFPPSPLLPSYMRCIAPPLAQLSRL